MKKYILYLTIVLSGLLILAGLSKFKVDIAESTSGDTVNNAEEKIKQLEYEIAKLREELASKELDIGYLKEERDYYRKFIDEMLEKLTEKEIIDILEREWWYTLKVKHQGEKGEYVYVEFPKDGKITINKTDFDLVLSEHTVPFSILEGNYKKYGYLLDQVLLRPLPEQIKIKNYDNYEMTGASGTVVDSTIYIFKGVPEGTEIEIEISEELRRKLGMDGKILLIKVE